MKILIIFYNEYGNNEYLFVGSPYSHTKRKRWSKNEKQVVLTAFGQIIKNGKLPSLKEINEVIKQNPCIKHRSSQVKKHVVT